MRGLLCYCVRMVDVEIFVELIVDMGCCVGMVVWLFVGMLFDCKVVVLWLVVDVICVVVFVIFVVNVEDMVCVVKFGLLGVMFDWLKFDDVWIVGMVVGVVVVVGFVDLVG